MVGPALMIDYETKNSYTVEVTAYDSSGADTAISGYGDHQCN